MRPSFSNKAFRDGIILCAIGVATWYAGVQLDLMDLLFEFAEEHEDYEIDEIILSIFVVGLLGFVYAFRRILDLRKEVRLRHQAEADTSWIAQHDILTRLPNRRMLNTFIAELSATHPSAPHVLYAIDLDGFKKVNDLVGHDGGNELLVEIARRLQHAFPDDLVCRLGGDEFIVVARETTVTDPDLAARKLVLVLEQPMTIAKVQVQVGASVGIARYPRDGANFTEVMRSADVALYSAKRRGRNHVVMFDRSMDEALAQRSEAEAALRHAIEHNTIAPHYQPLIELESGAIRGFEALARWQKADGTSIPPMVFIELAEDAGLITLLSERLLRQACKDALTWPKHTVLAFNISPTQLTDELLGLRIVQILNETGFPPHRLEIEITESALVRDLDAAIRIVDNLHAAGVQVALDDFGTGYSSLGQLSRLKFDKVKIDRSFVSTFEGDDKQEKIVRAIIGLGHGLGLVTTAEGIEEPEQLLRLRAMGCDFGQGYLFGKAMPPEAVQGFFAKRAAASTKRA